MKKVLNYLLLFSFIITNLASITGVAIHKPASVFFLLLCVIHTVVYGKQMQWKRWVLLGIIVISFVSIFCLAIHIFVFHRRLKVHDRRNSL